VYVRDSKLGDDSPVQEWPLTYWEFLCDAIVADLPRFSGYRKLDDGGVELRWAHIHPAPLIFDAGEWKAFVLGVRAGEFDPQKLSEGVSAGSGSVAGTGEAATGTTEQGCGVVPVAAEQPLDDLLDITLTGPPPVNPPHRACVSEGRHDHDPTSNPESRVLPEAAHFNSSAGRSVNDGIRGTSWQTLPAVQPGSEDAAGTEVPPVPVPAAQPRPIISDEAVEVLARRLHRSRYYGPMVDDVRDDHRWNELLIDREREEYRDAARAHLAAVYPLLRERWEAWSADDEEAWARAVAPLVPTGGVQ
jgi:hypothetical protein